MEKNDTAPEWLGRFGAISNKEKCLMLEVPSRISSILHSPMCVLHVEDNECDAEIFKRSLDLLNKRHTLFAAENGLEAIQLMRGDDLVRPDLIFVDVNMPKMDARKFLAVRKEDPDLSRIPTIILTASYRPIDVRDCYALHANAYIVKPHSAHEFKEKIAQTLAFWSGIALLYSKADMV